MINAEHLMTVGGVAAFFLTINWVRKRDLRKNMPSCGSWWRSFC